jgi:hypothetical protein
LTTLRIHTLFYITLFYTFHYSIHYIIQYITLFYIVQKRKLYRLYTFALPLLSLRLPDLRKDPQYWRGTSWRTLPFRSFNSNVGILLAGHSTGKHRVTLSFSTHGSLRLRSCTDLILHVRETLAADRRDRPSNMLNIILETSQGSILMMSMFLHVKTSRYANILLKASIACDIPCQAI